MEFGCADDGGESKMAAAVGRRETGRSLGLALRGAVGLCALLAGLTSAWEPRPDQLEVLGVSLDSSNNSTAYMWAGEIRARPGTDFLLRVFGLGLAAAPWPWLTWSRGLECGDADNDTTPAAGGKGEEPPLRLEPPRESGEHWALVTVRVAPSLRGSFSLCGWSEAGGWAPPSGGDIRLVLLEGGDEQEVPEEVRPPPLWAQLPLMAALLGASCVMTLLRRSALWLEPLELRLVRAHGGSERERRRAAALESLRMRGGTHSCGGGGNLILCALLLGNVMTNAALCAVAQLACGTPAAGVLTCAALVWPLGELLPRGLCCRYGFALASSAGGLWLTRLLVVLAWPLAMPAALALDRGLRQDLSACFIRQRILEQLLKRGASGGEGLRPGLGLGGAKLAEDVMTPLADCVMLSSEAVLDFVTLSRVMQSGHARIPVYEGDEPSHTVDVVHARDLALVDPEDRAPLSAITRFYGRPLHFVFNDTRLDSLLEEFRRGKSHMAMVQRVNNEGDGDPFYEVLGLVTLGDVIEEIIKSEILEESDTSEKKIRKKPAGIDTPLQHRKEDLTHFKISDNTNTTKIKISPQLLLATQRFLSKEVELFSPALVSERVLQQLLRVPGVTQEVRFDQSHKRAPQHYLYQRDKEVNYFTLILQGRVEVEIGKEGLKFENGAFTYYGVSALTAPSSVPPSPADSRSWSYREAFPREEAGGGEPNSFVPDYTVRALSELHIIKVTQVQYLNAIMASRTYSSSPSPDTFELKVMPCSQATVLSDHSSSQAAAPKLT